MEKEDWLKIVTWMAYVYAPIALLIIGIFVLVEYRAHQVETLSAQSSAASRAVSATTSPATR